MNPWSTFNQAVDAWGSQRVELLLRAKKELGGVGGSVSVCERDELDCCIAAVCVGERLAPVEEVAEYARSVLRRCGSSWPLCHLAESAHRLGAYQQVLDAVSEIEEGFFESQDLVWRSVRCAELRVVAMINLGYDRWDIETAVSAIAASYAGDDDEHDLASPRDLVDALVERAELFLPCLEILDLSLDLELWVGAERAALVWQAMETGSESTG